MDNTYVKKRDNKYVKKKWNYIHSFDLFTIFSSLQYKINYTKLITNMLIPYLYA
ncbi:hypothetical protein, partial [Plasmodium yoelii yoelii]